MRRFQLLGKLENSGNAAAKNGKIFQLRQLMVAAAAYGKNGKFWKAWALDTR
jgi:hypothetical protein